MHRGTGRKEGKGTDRELTGDGQGTDRDRQGTDRRQKGDRQDKPGTYEEQKGDRHGRTTNRQTEGPGDKRQTPKAIRISQKEKISQPAPIAQLYLACIQGRKLTLMQVQDLLSATNVRG